jgi:hypothetical protein
MSNARPLPWEIRNANYLEQTGRGHLTPRQARQWLRMRERENLIDQGALTHGAIGLPVRRPHRRAQGGAR